MAERVAAPTQGTTGLLVQETQAAAQQLGVGLVVQEIAHAGELADAFALYRRQQAPALIVQVGPLTLELRARITQLAAQQRLPAMYEVRNFVDDGGLVSYGPDLRESYRRAAAYVGQIFNGAKPEDLPVEQPDRLELVINLKTAKALGLMIPEGLLLRADQVIQ